MVFRFVLTSLKNSKKQVVPVRSVSVNVSHSGGAERAWDKTLWCKTPAFAHSQHENRSHE